MREQETTKTVHPYKTLFAQYKSSVLLEDMDRVQKYFRIINYVTQTLKVRSFRRT